MLCLTQTEGRAIHIGQDIVIHIIEAHNGKVKVGLEAPREYQILRSELIEYASQFVAAGTEIEVTEGPDPASMPALPRMA